MSGGGAESNPENIWNITTGGTIDNKPACWQVCNFQFLISNQFLNLNFYCPGYKLLVTSPYLIFFNSLLRWSVRMVGY
jgi:hypothetical protein